MSFTSGRVSYCRLRVVGDAPATLDETALSILKEHAFRETEIGAPDEVEVGWVTGEHLLDTQFSYEKNGFGHLAMFAMRIDTHKVPSDIRQAYKKINEQAAAGMNPSGFASRSQKKEAAEQAGRQLHEDLAAGKFRRSKMVPILWDLSRQVLYCAASGNAVLEQLAKLMRDSFAVNVEYLSAGNFAGQSLRHAGQGRDYEDLKPTAFTAPPPEARRDADEADGPMDVTTPLVPWVAQSVDLKDFLGNEFLIWLWWLSESAEGEIMITGPTGGEQTLFIAIDKTLDMDCAWDARGKQTLRSDGPTRLNEAAEALAGGKWPRKMGLIISDGENQWELTLQGDRLVVSAAALPEVADAQGPREVIEYRLRLLQGLSDALDAAYESFLRQRVSSGWTGRKDAMRRWIKERRKAAAAQPALAPA
jgi:hypothetical protein